MVNARHWKLDPRKPEVDAVIVRRAVHTAMGGFNFGALTGWMDVTAELVVYMRNLILRM